MKTEFSFDHFKYFRMLVLLIAISWDDTAKYLKELPNQNSVLKELSRLLVAA
ncbi:MAG: hypothetical protein SVZ03_03990 [Spirochaetota bacterium]|nr:hypothetical protein [Spirochaetota bacterium]